MREDVEMIEASLVTGIEMTVLISAPETFESASSSSSSVSSSLSATLGKDSKDTEFDSDDVDPTAGPALY